MLVLSRKVGQRLVISDDVTVVIQQISGKRVSIGIEAPDEVPIVRGELQATRNAFREPAGRSEESQECFAPTWKQSGFVEADEPPRSPR